MNNSKAGLIFWVTGIIGGCEINKSNTNKEYTGEFEIDIDYTQSELENCINKGEFVLHQVGEVVRVLDDINSFISFETDKNEIFNANQTIRVTDQIAVDVATIFVNKYLGKQQNNKDGRTSFWAEIVKHHENLQKIQAIEDFNSDDIVVEQGESKKSVVVTDAVTVVNAMAKLYMTVNVS